MLPIEVGFLIYFALGVIGMNLWRRRHPIVIARMQHDPARWRAYWLPLLIGVEMYLLAGLGFLYPILLRFSPMSHDPYFQRGLVIAAIFYPVLFIGIDVWMLMASQRELRREQVEQ